MFSNVPRPERRRLAGALWYDSTRVVDVDIDGKAKSGGVLAVTWRAADWPTRRLKHGTTKPRTPGAETCWRCWRSAGRLIGRVSI